MNISFNMHWNLILLIISGIYTNFCSLQCKKCDVGYYVINHGVYSFNFIIKQNS